MKNKFTLLAMIMATSVALNAQTINADITMGAGYANDVYYGLENQTSSTSNRQDWDIAFYRKSNFSTGIRINNTKGIEVYEASNQLSNWNTIDIANLASWKALYNSDVDWQKGALNNGSATYGWGNYDMASHFVKGTIVFVLKYNSGEYVKLKIDELNAPSGTYKITYSLLENNTWSADKTVSIAHSTSPNNLFNYFNFITGQIVKPEPNQNEWDLKFTKYITPLEAEGNTVMYNVTGVLQSDLVKIAKTDSGNPKDDNAYSIDINTIGYNWKNYDMNSGSYTIKPTNYFIKNTSTNKIYKLVFKTFEGSSTGKITFDYENVTNSLGTTDLERTKFGIYTIANQPKSIQIVYNSTQNGNSDVAVQIYSMNGQLVHQENYRPTSSFANKTIQLSKLPAGVYIVKLQVGNKVETKKIVLR